MNPKTTMMTSDALRRMSRNALFAGLACLLAIGLCEGAIDAAKAGDLWNQSVALEKTGDYKGALAKMAELGRNGGDPYLVSLRNGWLYYENKDYDLSIANYQAASARSASALSPLTGLAASYHAKGDNANTQRVCTLVLSRDPANETALQLLGQVYFDAKDYANAGNTFNTLLKYYPEDTTGLSGYGWALLYQSRKTEAIVPFQRLLVLSPSFPYAKDGYTAATTP